MLKLERKSQNGQIDLLVRDKEIFFNRPLIIAFCLALAFHLLFLVVFHVSLFKMIRGQTVFPEVAVTADATHLLDVAGIVTDINPLGLTIQGIPIPKFSEPEMGIYKPVITSNSLASVKNIEVADNLFSDIERGIYTPELFVRSMSVKQPIEIDISGVLAENNVIVEGLTNQILSSFAKMNIKSDQLISYEVLVDGKSGKIFWFQLKKNSSTKNLNKLAETMLRNITFSQDPLVFAKSGEIEFYFNKTSEDVATSSVPIEDKLL